MTKDALIDWAKSKGWIVGQNNHLYKANKRLKLNERYVRLESKAVGSSGWRGLKWAEYKHLTINDDDKLAGLKELE